MLKSIPIMTSFRQFVAMTSKLDEQFLLGIVNNSTVENQNKLYKAAVYILKKRNLIA